MLMETFDRLTRKDKYVWDVRIGPTIILDERLTGTS
jgi:hypothetical protein